jgi:hypothetical protein
MFVLLSMQFAERCKIRIADHSIVQAMGQQTGIPLMHWDLSAFVYVSWKRKAI